MKSLFFRIHKDIDSSEPHQYIDDASEKTISEDKSYDIEIEQSSQSSIDSSDNQKDPRCFSEIFRILDIFHEQDNRKIKNIII